MSDSHPFFSQAIDSGLGETPTVLPPNLVAQAVYLNRFSIVGVLVNPEKQSMRGLINQLPYIWGVGDEVIGRVLDHRKFQFVFKTEEALIRVLCKGPWSFADWMIVTKRWDATVTEENLKVVQFWVQIKGIPPHYLSREIIEFIGNDVAQVVDVDFEDFSNLTRPVWVLVNWNIDNPLCFKRNYQSVVGEILRLSFSYDRLRNFCVQCGMLTHDEKECPLHIDVDANSRRGEDIVGDGATGSGMYNERKFFTTAFTGTGMNVGPSGGASLPKTDIPRIDCDKLAETCRYLKAKFGKGKFPFGHKLGTTGATHQKGYCEEDAQYNPLTAGSMSYLRTESVYHPMEKRSPDNIFADANIDETLPMESIGGVKRKRDAYVKDTSSVDLYPDCKMKCNVGDLEKNCNLVYLYCKVNQVGDDGTSSRVVMNSKIKVEDCESVGSSDYIN